MKVAISGTRDDAAWPPIGGEITVPNTEGADLCSQGFAEPVVTTESEKAVPPAAEKRVTKRARNNAG